MKKILSILMVTALCAVTLAGCGGQGAAQSSSTSAPAPAESAPAKESSDAAPADTGSSAASGDPIRIGTLYPLTGDVAAIGENIMRGINFAVDEINEKGGINGSPIELVLGDTQGDATTGMSEAERLITQEDVVAIIGCYQSGVTEVVSQVTEEYKVPLLSAISTADVLTRRGYEYFFRMAPTNSMCLRDMIQFLVDYSGADPECDIKSIAVCADNTTLGQETSEWAQYFAKENGIEFLGEVLYTKGAADLTSEVLALKELNPDALVVDNYISDGILLTKTMSEQGYSPNVMIGKATAYIDPSYIPAVGDLANGIVTCAEFNPGAKGVEVSDAFLAEYGVNMNGHSAEAYTAVWIMKTAIENAMNAGEVSRDSIKEALSSIKIEKSFPGGNEIILPYETIEFSSLQMNGQDHLNTNAGSTLTILQIQDGGYQTVWPFNIKTAEVEYPASFGK